MFLYGTELWSDSQGRKVWTAWDTQFVQRKVLLSGLCLPGSSLSRATHAFFSLFPPFPSCQDLPSSPVHAKAHIRLARSCRETFSQCGDFCTCLVLKENKMVLGRRKAAGWKDREKSGLSPKEPFQKPAILGEIYSPTNDHLATNLEDPGQVNKLWHWKLHLIFRFSFFFLQHHEILYGPQLTDTDVVTASLAQPMRFHSFMLSLPRALPLSHFLFHSKILRSCPAPSADVWDKAFYSDLETHPNKNLCDIFRFGSVLGISRCKMPGDRCRGKGFCFSLRQYCDLIWAKETTPEKLMRWVCLKGKGEIIFI